MRERFGTISNIYFAIQEEQLGTGHAVAQAQQSLNGFHGDIAILSGDVPVLTTKTLKKFQEFHLNRACTASLISCKFDNPFGYGRIVRDTKENFRYIQEEKDTNDEERAITEVNS